MKDGVIARELLMVARSLIGIQSIASSKEAMKMMAKAMKANFWMHNIKKFAPKVKGSTITIRFANKPILQVDIAVDMKGVYYESEGDVTTIGGIADAEAYVNGRKVISKKVRIPDRTYRLSGKDFYGVPLQSSIFNDLAKTVWDYGDFRDMAQELRKTVDEEHRGTVSSPAGGMVYLRTTSSLPEKRIADRFKKEWEAVLQKNYPGSDIEVTIHSTSEVRTQYATFLEVPASAEKDGERFRLTWGDIGGLKDFGYAVK